MDVKNDLGGGKPTLLIAEDEESNYLLLKTILHKYCNLIRAKTGLEALALFKENEVDLILMDIKMPVMDGYQVLNTIRNMEKQRGIEGDDRVKIIMMTALNEQKNVRKAFEMGCTVYCAKPVDLDKLKNVLKKLKLI